MTLRYIGHRGVDLEFEKIVKIRNGPRAIALLGPGGAVWWKNTEKKQSHDTVPLRLGKSL